MKTRFLLLFPVVFCAASSAPAAISVGSSTLIGALDYSDSFTIGAGNPGSRYGNSYAVGAYPVAAGLLPLENNYGNTARSWTGAKWSLNNDANFLSGSIAYPGGSSGGSATGFTQTGGGLDYGVEYDLRSQFVVQFDAVQTIDRIDITAGNSRDTIGGANGLSVFFRRNGAVDPLNVSAEIGIYNPAVGELLTTLDTGLAGLDLAEWHNYAVRFDLITLQLGIYVDEFLLGNLDLNTLGGPRYNGGVVAPGAFAAVVNAATNDAISVGGNGGDRVWTDNFQVGAAVPEPGTVTLAGLAGLLLIRRRR